MGLLVLVLEMGVLIKELGCFVEIESSDDVMNVEEVVLDDFD
jgi:hypothetical protein